MSKRLGIIILLSICLQFLGKSFAQSQFSPTLTKMEKSLFGVDYGTQGDEARIKRIEDIVYGKPYTGTIQQRMSRLSNDLSADVIGQEIKPKADTFAEDESEVQAEPVPKEDKTVNYPAVDNLEMETFNKTFKGVDINQRLANLEQKVFKKSYNDDLNSRVDRLKKAVVPEKVAGQEDSDYTVYTPDDSYSGAAPVQEDYLSPKYSSAPKYNSKNSVMDDYSSDSDIQVPLSSIEKKILRQSFPNDEVPERLSRLEAKMFNSSFDEDDVQARMDRIASAYQAQKSSSRYDGNKFSQKMSTAMQVGAILLMILAAVL